MSKTNSPSSQPKPQPKSAATTKGAGATRGRGKAGRGRGAARNARPAKKTAEELDSEMVDYWQAGAAATEPNGAAQPAAGGDANMDDEILVCLPVACPVAKANSSLVSLIGAWEQRYASDRDGRMIFAEPMFLFPNIAIVLLLLRPALNSAAKLFIKEWV